MDTGVQEHAAATDAVDVILRDGSTLRLRSPLAADSDAVRHFFERLSEQSLYLRFHGIQRIGDELVGHFLDPDWQTSGSLIGTLADDGTARVVALGTWARLRDPSTAEAAFTVADEYQRRGIGTRLLEQLAQRAGEAGIERFVAIVLPQNQQMLKVFERVGFDVTRELAQGEVEISFSIRSTEAYRERVESRDHVATAASLAPFFAPRSVAVTGASQRAGSIGGELFRNILRADFNGAAYPVNRGAEPVAGVRGYASIADVPDDIDLAVICLPGERVIDAAAEALNKGVRALCVISAGFAETGPAGIERQERLLALVRAHGARLVGPNCLGIAVSKVRLNATFGPKALPPGNVGFSSQSGALGLALLETAAERGLGFSSFVSIGNKADVSSNDLLEYWQDDEDTGVVLMYLESFGNPRKFGHIARRLARAKPVLAMKSGTTRAGARAASSHTAALAGSDAAVDALFHQAGVIRATTLEELIDATVLLSSQPLPRGRRVAVLTNAGGLGILCADACEAAGLELPELGPESVAALRELLPAEASVANPIDMLGSATEKTYEAVVPILLADGRVDAVILLFVPPVMAGADAVAGAISRVVTQAQPDKPVLAAIVAEGGIPAGLTDAGVAAFPYPESAARALGLAARRAEWLRRPQGTAPHLDDVDLARAKTVADTALARADDGWLVPGEVRALLESFGFPLVPERLADTPDAAARAAAELGFPAVVKTAEAGAHKTESGGVALDLRGEAEVRAAAERIGCPVVVQPMVGGGVELLAGLVQDPVFGPLVAFGPGGVYAELIGSAEFRIAPLTDVDAEELVTSGKAGRLVAGFRGRAPASVAALTDLLNRLSLLGEQLPEVAELDLNPVIASESGCVAVDARIRVQEPDRAPRTKSW
ncbi:MAG: bifunctional acetate--CoA ligase family protein/GNAT family N-acetyltransferase [Gaiellaceae bacterium]